MDTVLNMTGSIRGEIASNSVTRTSPSLTIFIQANTEPGDELSLEWIEPEVRQWDNIEGRKFRFSLEPTIGFIDGEEIEVGSRLVGTLQHEGAARPVRALSIEFGSIGDGGIGAHLSIHGHLPTSVGIDCILRIEDVRVRGDLARLRPPSHDEALLIASSVVDVERFSVGSDERGLALHLKSSAVTP